MLDLSTIVDRIKAVRAMIGKVVDAGCLPGGADVARWLAASG